MKNPILIVVAICVSCAFPPLFLITGPAIFATAKHEQHRLQHIEDQRAAAFRDKRRTKAIRAFASGS